MNARRARVVALMSGVAFAVTALAAPAAAADSNERWLGTIGGGIELYERCARDEPILWIEGRSSSSNDSVGIHRLDESVVGNLFTATYAPTSMRMPAGDYIASYGSRGRSGGDPVTVRPCPFPGSGPTPQPTQTVEASIGKLSGGRFRVTVDNRKVPDVRTHRLHVARLTRPRAE